MSHDDRRVPHPPNSRFRIGSHRPDETLGLSKDGGRHAARVDQLAALHDLLYAEHKRALLIVLQGMDAAGKDGTIRHVMSGVNPQGCAVTPSSSPAFRNWTTIFSGAFTRPCRRRGRSASSTGRITKTCWYRACTSCAEGRLDARAMPKSTPLSACSRTTACDSQILPAYEHGRAGRNVFSAPADGPERTGKLPRRISKSANYWDEYQDGLSRRSFAVAARRRHPGT